VVALAAAIATTAVVLASCKLFDVDPPAAAADAGIDSAVVDGPAPGFPGFVPLVTAARACSKILACPPVLASSVQTSLTISMDATNFSHCVDALAGPLDPDRLNKPTTERLECVASANTCDEATACMLYRSDVPADPRCEGAKKVLCVEDGGAVLACESSTSIKIDCKNPAFPPGAVCKIFVTAAGDDHGFCVVDTPCSADTCRGSVFDGCIRDATNKIVGHQVIDCAAGGLRCVGIQTGCVGDPCVDISVTTCSSTRMAICGIGSVANVDCAHIGGTCIKSSTVVACARDGDECNVFDEPRRDRCADANAIKLCVGGKSTTFSCADIGMKCVPAAGIRSSYCAP
jgi:hypothetical protein